MHPITPAMVEQAIARTNQAAIALELNDDGCASLRARIFEQVLNNLQFADDPNTEGEPDAKVPE